MFQKDIHKFSLILAAAILLFTNPTYSEDPPVNATKQAQIDFFTALQNGNKDAAEEALGRGAIWTVADRFGRRPYMYAAESGDLEFYLWAEQNDTPTDINEKDNASRTALHFAAGSINQNGYPADLVRYLRSKGADANAKNNSGQTPLFETTTSANIEAAMALFEAPMNTGDFLAAYKDEDPTKYQRLIQKAIGDYNSLPAGKKVDVTATTNNSETPLHVLFQNGESDFANFLLNQGVPIDIVTNNRIVSTDETTGEETLLSGETAMGMAERKLREKNEKLVRAKDTDGATALVAALDNDINKLNAILTVYNNFVAENNATKDAITEDEDSSEKQDDSATAVAALSPERGELLTHIADLYTKWRGEVVKKLNEGEELLDHTSEENLFVKFFTLPGTVPINELSLPKDIDGDLSDSENTTKLSLPSPYWYSKKIGHLKITREEYLRLGKVLHTKGIMNVSAEGLNELIPETRYNVLFSDSDNFNTRIEINPKIKASEDSATDKITYEITAGKVGISLQQHLASFLSSEYLELFELFASFDEGKTLLSNLLEQINNGEVTIKQPTFVPDSAKVSIPNIYIDSKNKNEKVLYVDRFTPLEILLPEFFQALIDIKKGTTLDSVLIGLSRNYDESIDNGAKEVIKIILKSKVPILMRILNQSTSPELKIAAANLLGALGSNAQKAVGALKRQANYADLSPSLRSAAKAALAKISQSEQK